MGFLKCPLQCAVARVEINVAYCTSEVRALRAMIGLSFSVLSAFLAGENSSQRFISQIAKVCP